MFDVFIGWWIAGGQIRNHTRFIISFWNIIPMSEHKIDSTWIAHIFTIVFHYEVISSLAVD